VRVVERKEERRRKDFSSIHPNRQLWSSEAQPTGWYWPHWRPCAKVEYEPYSILLDVNKYPYTQSSGSKVILRKLHVLKWA
jgi:hypothetical protein